MLIPSRSWTLQPAWPLFGVLLALGLALSACGDSKAPASSVTEDDSVSTLDVHEDIDVADTVPAKCALDEACRQALAVGPCEDARCVDGACQVFAMSEQMPCDDGNPCTEATRCQAGQCIHGFTTLCDDSNPCTKDGCDPLTGCDYSPRMDTSECDDSDPCTDYDICVEGACVGTLLGTCTCEQDADCAPFEDDNLCNGSMHCMNGSCRLDGMSGVECPDAAKCFVSACVPSTGQCSTWPAANGVHCDNGDPCSLDDTCEDGVCLADEQICTCEQDADCAVFAQAGFNLCLGPLICESGFCAPDSSEQIVCEPQGACLHVACQPDTGLCATIPLADDSPCDASELCPTGGACQQGQCVANAPPCDDDDPCTADSCAGDSTCTHEPFSGPCEDGDPCTSGETCVDLLCSGGTPQKCDDLNPCTIDACAPALGGCIFEDQADGVDCASGDPCLEGGTCSAGQCADQLPVVCDAEGPCMKAVCLPGEGCAQKNVENDVTCSTGDLCEKEGVCEEGICQSLPLSCNDDNPCTADTCDSDLEGCVHTNKVDGVNCDSSDPCVENSQCTQGVCGSGEPVQCESGPCDVRSCDSDTGVCEILELLEDGTPCEGEQPCQTPGICESGACYEAQPCPEDS
jgi:hypothetical protein